MKVIQFETLPSTNLYLKENYHKLDDFTVVQTDKQTNGKGRMQRKWFVDDSSLTFSILLKPHILESLIPLISLVAGASVYLTIKQYIDCSIKWPNDIMINNKKVCGILVEAVSTSTIEAVIVGIGININQEVFSDEIQYKATSLKKEIHQSFDKQQIMYEILINFRNLYNDFKNNNYTFLSICQNNNYLKGKKAFYNNREVEILDINNQGNLLVKDNNEVLEIFYGEITLEQIYQKN